MRALSSPLQSPETVPLTLRHGDLEPGPEIKLWSADLSHYAETTAAIIISASESKDSDHIFIAVEYIYFGRKKLPTRLLSPTFFLMRSDLFFA